MVVRIYLDDDATTNVMKELDALKVELSDGRLDEEKVDQSSYTSRYVRTYIASLVFTFKCAYLEKVSHPRDSGIIDLLLSLLLRQNTAHLASTSASTYSLLVALLKPS